MSLVAIQCRVSNVADPVLFFFIATFTATGAIILLIIVLVLY